MMLGVMAILLAACSGLGSEPRIVSTLPPPTPTIAESAFPRTAPDVALGATLYARHCTQCHGESGAGDGALVQSGQVQNAGNFRLRETAGPQRPSDWHATITNGNLELLMPPWGDALSEDERWAVALYTYTLHYTPESLARGRELYAAHCAECHGASGAGDGERAGEYDGALPSLTNQEKMTTLSDDVLYNILTEGQGTEMKGFTEEMTDDERRDVVAYTRTLSLANPDRVGTFAVAQAQPAETPELTAGAVGTVRGQIVNGTAGAPIPPDLPITLFYYDADLRESTLTTTADANGAFVFTDVPMSETFQYAAIATYGDRSFFNPPVPGSASGALDLQVTIYELTEDPSVLTITGMVAQVTAIGESLEVTQLFTVNNFSDRAFSTAQTTVDGRPVSLTMPLPPGAIIVGFPNGEARFVASQDGTAVQDTLAVLPNAQHIVAVVYIIPYAGSAIIEQPFNYAVNGGVRVLVRPETVTLRGDRLPSTGTETVGQTEWSGYGGVLTFAAGDVLRYELAGAAESVAGRDGGVVTANNLLPIILLVIVGEILLVGGLYWWWRRRRAAGAAATGARPTQNDPMLMDGLIRQIAELDAQHERGEIADEAYQRQRALLKARLTELMDKK
jgi:mono/diheme cytochrome c family protein